MIVKLLDFLLRQSVTVSIDQWSAHGPHRNRPDHSTSSHRNPFPAERGGRIAKAAEARALAGSIAEGMLISMDIEQILYEAGRLQDAASLLNRLSRE